jgi:hypothetical protein|mmetsp:Transcript_3613/g.5641  ORF Transcript_3613/g.5641 Transcript_3613/m.5641 type:complete len:95 (-) Transcript_3613:27-311(-)
MLAAGRASGFGRTGFLGPGKRAQNWGNCISGNWTSHSFGASLEHAVMCAVSTSDSLVDIHPAPRYRSKALPISNFVVMVNERVQQHINKKKDKK